MSINLHTHPDREEAYQAAVNFLAAYDARDGFGGKRIIDPDGTVQSRFTAGGHTYRVLMPDHGMSLERMTVIMQRISLVGSDLTLAEQQAEWQRLYTLSGQLATEQDKPTRGQLFTAIFEIIRNGTERLQSAKRKWRYSDYAAAAICVRDGEDIKHVDESLDDEKIKDFNDAMIYPPDFFFLCLLWDQRYNETLRQSLTRIVP